MHIQDKQDKNNISEYFTLRINDQKGNIFEDNDDNDYLILSNEELGYIYDINLNKEGNNKNNIIESKYSSI